MSTKKTSAPDIHESLKHATQSLKQSKRARELAQTALDRAEAALSAAFEVERDCERSYTAARKAVVEAYPDVSRT